MKLRTVDVELGARCCPIHTGPGLLDDAAPLAALAPGLELDALLGRMRLDKETLSGTLRGIPWRVVGAAFVATGVDESAVHRVLAGWASGAIGNSPCRDRVRVRAARSPSRSIHPAAAHASSARRTTALPDPIH